MTEEQHPLVGPQRGKGGADGGKMLCPEFLLCGLFGGQQVGFKQG